MKRLLPILAMALLGLSGCDSGTVVSPLAPEVGQPFFAKAGLPAGEATEECPEVGNILFPEATLYRGPGTPAAAEGTFGKCGFIDATLVVQVSNPKTTTVKAWLNGVMVLHPSEFPRTGRTEFSLPFPLADLNGLEVRLSAKPGTDDWARVWVEGVGTPTPSGSDPENETSLEFHATEASFDLTADMNAACVGEYGASYGIADWSQVVAAVEGGAGRGDILLGTEIAMVLYEGVGSFNTGFPFFETRHYMISAVGADAATVAWIGTDLFWATSGTMSQPVLCVSTSESSSE